MQQHTDEQGLLGLLSPGQKKLLGKTFYLDSVKKRATALLLETISLLGGGVESFLHKDVCFVVTGSQECLKEQKCTDTKAGAKGTSATAQHPVMTRESVLTNDKRRPGTLRPMACGSRGKALLEKAIRNNEQLQKSSVLANARSWGVKILYVDDVLLYLKQLTLENFSTTQKRPEKTCSKQQGSNSVKAAPLRSPYLKIEDISRKYKPLHMQSMTFPTLWYSGRFSPFESPPPQFAKRTEQAENSTREKKKNEISVQIKSQTPLSCNPSPWRPRKKDLSYCECCHQPFTNLEEHLQSDQHRAFVLDFSNYTVVDQLVAEMLPGFNPYASQEPEETLNRSQTPLSMQDVYELEPLNDAETEHAVQALQRQGSSLTACMSSPTRGPLDSAPGSPSPGILFSLPNLATPPAVSQPFTTNTDCQVPNNHPHALSVAMPLLDVEPEAHNSAGPQCPDRTCPSPDPYSLPPVLSPQVPYPSCIMEPHSPYSEAPVLSPQQYITEEALTGHTSEWDMAESVFQSVPVPMSTSFPPSVTIINAEEVKRSNLESPLELHNSMCITSGLKVSATAQNPKKRSRSASPEHTWSKRKRMKATVDCGGSWNESLKPESGIIDKPDKLSCQIKQPCPNSEISSTCALEMFDLKENFTTFCAPVGQNQTPKQMDILGHGSNSVADESSWPHSSKAKNFDTCSRDSQHSLSHSTSVCIESALIPDLAMLSASSSDSDWDCDLLSRLEPTSAAPLSPTKLSCELDKEFLHRPCIWMQDTSYESRLHTVLQPSTPGTSLCGEEMNSSAFSRTIVKIVEVRH